MNYSSFIDISTRGFSDIVDITRDVAAALSGSGIREGLLTVFITGSTASVTTIEFESGAVDDLKEAIERLRMSSTGTTKNGETATASPMSGQRFSSPESPSRSWAAHWPSVNGSR